MDRKNWVFTLFLVSITALFLFSGCAGMYVNTKGYGTIRPNKAVTQAFESYAVKPDHVYYVSGSESHPTAIIAIDKRYTLETDLWKRRVVDPDKASYPKDAPYPLGIKFTLRYYVDGMQHMAHSEQYFSLTGFDILDDKGNDIGDWYSLLNAKTVIRMLGENRVSATPPPIDLYERFERDGREDAIWRF
ncbi:MAG: hypothetical protein JXC33_06990 [Deltaproteobacteria bacterium]|nr:hypothetical protein [Deltaproteobacteria bacterium]